LGMQFRKDVMFCKRIIVDIFFGHYIHYRRKPDLLTTFNILF
jgi:hypothetical protein